MNEVFALLKLGGHKWPFTALCIPALYIRPPPPPKNKNKKLLHVLQEQLLTNWDLPYHIAASSWLEFYIKPVYNQCYNCAYLKLSTGKTN